MTEDQQRDRPQVTLAQVLGSSGAAVSSAVVCSYFGIAGTVIGTAIASSVATIGAALYSYWARRTQARLRAAYASGLQATTTAVTKVAVVAPAASRVTRLRTRVLALPWVVIIAALNVFVFGVAVAAGIEGIIGESVPAAVGVHHSGSGLLKHHHSSSTPTPAPTATGSSSSSPTVSPTVTATVTQTQTPTPSPSVTTSPTASTRTSPRATATPTAGAG
jgi:hypothetical protein